MKEEQFLTLADIEAAKPIYLGPCDTFSIPARNGCQALTVIEATPVGEVVVGMRRESGPAGVVGPSVAVRRKLYKRHYAVWVN
jgi:hypothetical protein